MNSETVAAFDSEGVLEFGSGGRLLVWSWRWIAAGYVRCPIMTHEFTQTCGEDAAEVFSTLCVFLRSLAYASRRRLSIGHPGSISLTSDERQVLTLLAAAQADLSTLFDAHLCWISRIDAREILVIGSYAFAAALKANNLYFSLPPAFAPMEAVHRERRSGKQFT